MKYSKNKERVLLVLILLIAAFFRLYQLGSVPASIDWDEAALGYNAYSILNTGKDEYGKLMPFVLQSFNDYKPALYSYISIPSIAFFGLTPLAVRFPSALLGILTVFASYFLIKYLFASTTLKTSGNRETNDEQIPLVATLLLAISPWHIQFSRVAFESNLGLSLNIFGILFFILGLKKRWLLVLSTLSFALSLYAYQSEKVFVPLLFLGLVFFFRKEFFAVKRAQLFAALIIGFIVALPLVQFTFTDKNALTRANGVSIFSDRTAELERVAVRELHDSENSSMIGKVFDNRRIVFTKTIIANYLSYFDINWIFLNGDKVKRHQPPGMGHLYVFELPFLLIGIYMLFFGNYTNKTKQFIFYWLLITPIPAAVTWDGPNAVRTINFLPVLQIFSAIGILWFYELLIPIRQLILRIFFIFVSSFMILFNISYYIDQYFVQYNYYDAVSWQFGYKQLVQNVKTREKDYRKIVVSNEVPLDQSYIFFLFYLRYPPHLYQKSTANTSGEYKSDHRFGKFEFRQIQWEKEQKGDDILFIDSASNPPLGRKVIDTIFLPDGKPVMILVEG